MTYYGLWWLYSVNYEDIGSLYMLLGLWFGMVGAFLSILVRVELGRPGTWMTSDQLYNPIVTMHAFIMTFFLVMPTMIGGFGNWLTSTTTPSPDTVYAHLNNMSLWFLASSLFYINSGG